MIGVGIIGTGFGAAVHVPGFLALPDVKVVGVASARYERARETAHRFSLDHAFADWRDLVDSPAVDAVAIATPPSCHGPMVLRALAARKAVLCEKPLALTADEAERLHDAATTASVTHAVDFEFREIPAWRYVHRLLTDGVAGRIRHVNVNWVVGSWADPERSWSWRASDAEGGGTLGALAAHAFDYIEWLLGPVASVAAHLATRVASRPDERGLTRAVTSEDCCHLLLELASGVPVSLAISAIAPVGKGHWVEIYGEDTVIVLRNTNVADYARGVEVLVGRRGDDALTPADIPRGLRLTTEFADGRVAPFVSLAQRFIEAVHVRGRMRPSFYDGWRAQLVASAARRAHRERRWVDVDAPTERKDS